MPCFPPPMEKQVSVDSRLRFIAKTPGEEPLLPSHVRLSGRFTSAHILCGWEMGSLLPAGLVPRRAHPRPACKETCTAASSPGSGRGPSAAALGSRGGRLEQNPFVPSQGTAAHRGLAGGGAVPAQLGGPGGALAWGPACIPPPGSAGMWAVPREKRRWGPAAEPPESPSARLGGRSPRRQHSERLGTPATCPRWPPLVPSPRRAPQADRGFIN